MLVRCVVYADAEPVRWDLSPSGVGTSAPVCDQIDDLEHAEAVRVSTDVDEEVSAGGRVSDLVPVARPVRGAFTGVTLYPRARDSRVIASTMRSARPNRLL
ncbi:hypothetical protein EBM89_05970 [Cellulomonas triticagri]|uniref:Uncharacterized protein n=1 Tax=Cellulomonas triticagri TaxID=2483352 RepID=A0A3M2JHG0_9CELL|nr:hypothetical protein EBM89_05970 [Cellulomonas triticagri]